MVFGRLDFRPRDLLATERLLRFPPQSLPRTACQSRFDQCPSARSMGFRNYIEDVTVFPVYLLPSFP